jgi:DNA replication protein DnaC
VLGGDKGCRPYHRRTGVVLSDVLVALSQLPRWHKLVGDPTLADGILDRLVHNAHRIEMRGDSMRKNRGKPNP